MDTPYAAGIVGSRRRNTITDRRITYRLVAWIYDTRGSFSIVSGGCPEGADKFAEDAAKWYGPSIQMIVYPIDKKGITNRWEFTKRAYDRNRLVAERAEELFALIAEDRTGGTENTIKQALELGKRVYLVTTSGEVYLSLDGTLPKCDPEVRLLDWNFTD